MSEIASAIHTAGANLEDSRMAILGGEFALLLLLSGSEAAAASVGPRSSGRRAARGQR